MNTFLIDGSGAGRRTRDEEIRSVTASGFMRVTQPGVCRLLSRSTNIYNSWFDGLLNEILDEPIIVD